MVTNCMDMERRSARGNIITILHCNILEARREFRINRFHVTTLAPAGESETRNSAPRRKEFRINRFTINSVINFLDEGGDKKRAVDAKAAERRDVVRSRFHVTPVVGSVATHQRRSKFHISPVNESVDDKDRRHNTSAVPASRFRVSPVETSPVAAPQKNRFRVSPVPEQNKSRFHVTPVTNSSIPEKRENQFSVSAVSLSATSPAPSLRKVRKTVRWWDGYMD